MRKALDGLPPADDHEGRVRYVWNRIQAEAHQIAAAQDVLLTTSPGGAGAAVASGEARTGRRASISVHRMMLRSVLSCSSLLQSLARRVPSLMSPTRDASGDSEIDRDELGEYFAFYNHWNLSGGSGERASDDDDNDDDGGGIDEDGGERAASQHATRIPARDGEPLPMVVLPPALPSPQTRAPERPRVARVLTAAHDSDIAAQRRHFRDQRRRLAASLALTLEQYAAEDLIAHYDRDPAVLHMLEPLLYHKGFHALQVHRLAERLWFSGEIELGLLLQSAASRCFGVDIHPAARVGARVMIDHGTGVVIGETAVIGDEVSLLHGVTLGGTGKVLGDRHPKVGHRVVIGAGAIVLGNISIGDGARIAAGAVVVKPVAAGATVIGTAAKEIAAAPGTTSDAPSSSAVTPTRPPPSAPATWSSSAPAFVATI